MGKLNLVVEDAPVKVAKNEDSYKEVGETFDTLEIGKMIQVSNEVVPSLGLISNIKKFIHLKPEQEDIRISRTYGADKKLSGVKLIKTIFKARKPKEAKLNLQGEAENSQASV